MVRTLEEADEIIFSPISRTKSSLFIIINVITFNIIKHTFNIIYYPFFNKCV